MIPADLSPLANHLLQSTLFTAAAWLLAMACRKNRAAVRYAIWLAASVKYLVPFSLLVIAGSQSGIRVTPAIRDVPILHSQTFALPGGAVGAVPAADPSSSIPAVLLGIWFCGFVVSAAVWFRYWTRLGKALRSATPLHLDVPIPVVTSPGRLEPGAFGIWKPVLLLPEGIVERLTPAQLRSILAHELCHVRRRDNLTAAIHLLVESIFWFHPLVWWIGARLVEERERACDEDVVRLGNAPDVYAEGILQVCRFYLQSPLPCVAGVTGADLKKRIEAIVNNRTSESLTTVRKLMLAAAGVGAVAGPVLIGILNVPQSRAQSPVEQLPREAAPAGTVRAQSTKPKVFAAQRLRFEPIPEPAEPPPASVSEARIEAVEFRGAKRIAPYHLRAMVVSRSGGVYDVETLRRDTQALYNTGRFSDVSWTTEPGSAGVIVRFTVVERPLIQSIEYQGDGTLSMAEILERFEQRKVRLRVETLFNEYELGRAAATIQELLSEKGRENVTVTPLVERSSPPSTVKIVFKID